MSSKSEQLFATAQNLIPGGVNSPVRAFRGVGGTPRFIQSARGATITDVDGKTYIDYVGSWGPMILGHADEEVVAAVREVAVKGTSFGAPTELEVELAQEVIDAVPSIEMVRMVSSGTEATMSAIRLARGVTGRTKLVKFEGCYHGHADSLLVKAGSGVATLGLPDSPGVPAPLAQNTLTLPYSLHFREVGELGSDPDKAVDDKCRASCVDWYGNARPLFLRGRVFALLGYEIVEGAVDTGRIREVRRVNFAPQA